MTGGAARQEPGEGPGGSRVLPTPASVSCGTHPRRARLGSPPPLPPLWLQAPTRQLCRELGQGHTEVGRKDLELCPQQPPGRSWHQLRAGSPAQGDAQAVAATLLAVTERPEVAGAWGRDRAACRPQARLSQSPAAVRAAWHRDGCEPPREAGRESCDKPARVINSHSRLHVCPSKCVCVGMSLGRARPGIQQAPSFIWATSSNLLIVSLSRPGLGMEISHQTARARKVAPSWAPSSALGLRGGERNLPEGDSVPGSLQTPSCLAGSVGKEFPTLVTPKGCPGPAWVSRENVDI